MSEVLVDVAYPLIGSLRLPEHEAEYRLALDLASVIWSVSRVPDDAERQRLLEEILHPKAGPLEPDAFDAIPGPAWPMFRIRARDTSADHPLPSI